MSGEYAAFSVKGGRIHYTTSGVRSSCGRKLLSTEHGARYYSKEAWEDLVKDARSDSDLKDANICLSCHWKFVARKEKK